MNNLSLPDCVLWDMDGTLIDQTESIIRCYYEVFKCYQLDKLPSPYEIKRSLGGPLNHTLGLFLPEDSVEEASNDFKSRFPKYMFDGMHILEGSIELMRKLNSIHIKQAILTNKQGINARAVSKKCGFDTYIPVCLGNNDNAFEKPDVRFTNSVLEAIDAETKFKDIVIIGDSPTDVLTAKNCGARCFAVSTGSHSEAELKNAGAEHTFSTLLEIIKFWSL